MAAPQKATPKSAPPVADCAPRPLLGVMVSGTFTDLKGHRDALIRSINGHPGLKAVAMENESAKADVDVLESSLQMVRDSAAYVGVISLKYGQMPTCMTRNPDKLSITELEFNEAQRLKRPVLLFIMGGKHRGQKADFESNPGKEKKLNAFRERAKLMTADAKVHRVYATFESLTEFKDRAAPAVAGLARFLETAPVSTALSAIAVEGDPIPKAPAFYAEPPYIGSHAFLGRKDQLETLSEWAASADPHPVLLFEAIGGTGKSMLTWEWTTTLSAKVRGDWAGRFWYSFYEKGAVMADFCQRALAYMTGRSLDEFRKKKATELGELLLHQLRASPWLIILDGLERVLVSYHRIDAAQLADEEAGTSDQIAARDPCSAIRPEDDDLLRALAAAAPSKLLVTSRLVPRVLLNPASQAIPGVRRVPLPGLRPADAEALFRACGVKGTSQDIQAYLKNHCDCHPLVTGVLAGLINDYLPDRGNFNTWAADAAGGGRFNLASLNLVQKRNHILHAALDALPEKSRQLLSTLALLSESVDYATLSALNPHLPPEPKKISALRNPEKLSWWKTVPDEEKKKMRDTYRRVRIQANGYEQAIAAYRCLPEVLAAPQELQATVRDLERRGLLQYDQSSKRHDLHPVVRGVAAGGLRQEEKNNIGQRVVDYFSQQTQSPYAEAESLDDLRNVLQIVRALHQMGRYDQAQATLRGGLTEALFANLEADVEILSLVRPFFPDGWANPPIGREGRLGGGYLANAAAMALAHTGAMEEAFSAYGASIRADLSRSDWLNVGIDLRNVAISLSERKQFAKEARCLRLALDLAEWKREPGILFNARLFYFWHLSVVGRWAEAGALWSELASMGRDWPRSVYTPGFAERAYAWFRFYTGELRDADLAVAEIIARRAKNRVSIRDLHSLRGEWLVECGEWARSVESLQAAMRMAHEIGQADAAAEAQLALAKFRLNQLSEPRQEAERLGKAKAVSHCAMADLWLAIGDREQAKTHAVAAYKSAWAYGEPYVQRFRLNQARSLLKRLGAEIPTLPPYDPLKDEKLPWEDEIAAAIKKAMKARASGARTKRTPKLKASRKEKE